MKKGISRIALCALIIVALAGCDKWKTSAMTYESVGVVLDMFQSTAKQLCAEGKIKPEVCKKLQDKYNQARITYIKAGNLLISAMNVEGTVNQKDIMKNYSELMIEIDGIVAEIISILKVNGIDIGVLK